MQRISVRHWSERVRKKNQGIPLKSFVCVFQTFAAQLIAEIHSSYLTDSGYMLSLTWNAPREALDNPEQILFSGKSVDDLSVSNTAIYKFCGVQILPSFSCFDVMKAPRISEDMERLKAHLREVLK